VKDSDLITVGWAYGQAEAALAMALLGGAGIKTSPDPWYFASVRWDWTHAFGGIALRVPSDQSADAVELLAANPIVRRPRHWLWRLLMAMVAVAVFFWVNVPPPPFGCFPAIRSVSSREAAASR
jgi:hypothetical protein